MTTNEREIALGQQLIPGTNFFHTEEEARDAAALAIKRKIVGLKKQIAKLEKSLRDLKP